MQITFFFRKSSSTYHSIEKLFSTIIHNIPEPVNLHCARYTSNGLFKRFLIGLDARKNQGQLNHITGDIHFVAMFLKRNRTVLTIHDLGVLGSGNKIKRFILKLFWFDLPLKFVKKVTVISEFTRNELLSKCKVNPDKVIFIPNCYPEIYEFTGEKIRGIKPMILHIGTKPNKNLERLIKSLFGINCKLVIVGKLTELQTKLLTENQIEFQNFVNLSENEMFDLYKQSDILAYISTYEGFGLPVIEANAVGRPVLASNIEPIKTVAKNAALLVNPFDIDDIRKGIIRLIEDIDLCKDLIKNGYENAKRYHPKKIVKQYMEVYESIVAKK